MQVPRTPNEAGDGGGASAETDGRRLRSLRSRERILTAVLDAMGEADGPVTFDVIAERAGVSLSTIFRHFGDAAGVQRAIREHVLDRMRPILERGPFEGPLEQRVAELVRRRQAIFDLAAPIYNATGRRARQAPVAQAALRRQLREALEPELGPEGGDREALVALVVGVESFWRLREVEGIRGADARHVITRGVLALLAADL